MTLSDPEWPLNFDCNEERFQNLCYILTVEAAIYRIFLSYHVASRDVRKRTVMRRIFGICGRTADLLWTKSCERYIVETLTNKANIII